MHRRARRNGFSSGPSSVHIAEYSGVYVSSILLSSRKRRRLQTPIIFSTASAPELKGYLYPASSVKEVERADLAIANQQRASPSRPRHVDVCPQCRAYRITSVGVVPHPFSGTETNHLVPVPVGTHLERVVGHAGKSHRILEILVLIWIPQDDNNVLSLEGASIEKIRKDGTNSRLDHLALTDLSQDSSAW